MMNSLINKGLGVRGVHSVRGAALFISLMFLIVLTLLGLSAANVGILQERMAGNIRDTNVAFQQAEAALRAVEQRLQSVLLGGGGGLGVIPIWSEFHDTLGVKRGDCSLSAVEGDIDDWPWQPSADVGGAEYLVVELSGTSSDGMFFGSACRPMQSESNGNPGESAVYYMVAARAPGPSGKSQAVVQSIYFWPI